MNQRAAARYDITLVEAKSPAGFHLNVKINEAFDQWASISEGAYALKTDLTDWSDEKLWRAYIQLAQAEAAFRVQKAPRRAWQLPRTVLEEIKRIQCHDVCLPTTTHGEIKLRCVTQPDELQAMLLDRLGITLPKRLRLDETERPIALSAPDQLQHQNVVPTFEATP